MVAPVPAVPVVAEVAADPALAWRRMDLHLHTPASSDYQEPEVSALDVVRQAEARRLDIIAFTDHNSVRGYAAMWREIEDLELLEHLGRLEPAEAERLAEYRRLLDTILVLPGFEFTSTFGFHILAIFPEGTSVRLMEHILLALGVPEDRLGSGEVGATTDVLGAYELLDRHGALVIGAHVNSANGIAMQGLRFGGQTKIAYTQDKHLHALEVTDLLASNHRRSTAHFFSGIKAEYPRRMHCIQGSDAHRLRRDPERESNLGIGDRATEILLPEISFAAIKTLLQSAEFDRTRPYIPDDAPVDLVKVARSDGNTDHQAFHERLSTKRTGVAHVLRDIVALANTEGGDVYVGASPFDKRPPVGVEDVPAATAELQAEITRQITPPLTVGIETLRSGEKDVLVVRVPRGLEQPYALAPGAILVRRGAESVPAGRDEIVAMVRSAATSVMATPATPATPELLGLPAAPAVAESGPLGQSRRSRRRGGSGRTKALPSAGLVPLEAGGGTPPANGTAARGLAEAEAAPDQGSGASDVAPRTGVEIAEVVERNGERTYTMRDLRFPKLVPNVTPDTHSRLWRYAIQQREEHPLDPAQVVWKGDYGYWKAYKPRGGDQRYNLVSRSGGHLRVFYGVSEDGLEDRWREVLPARA